MAKNPVKTNRRAGIPVSVSSAQQLRNCIYSVITKERFSAILDTVCLAAENDDLSAAKIIFDRCLGPPVELDMTERVARLEQMLQQRNDSEKLDAGQPKQVIGYIKRKSD